MEPQDRVRFPAKAYDIDKNLAFQRVGSVDGMAKIVTRYGVKFWGVLGFELLGSIILLGTALFFAAGMGRTTAWFEEFFLAIGMISSVSLLILSFGNFGMINSLSKIVFDISIVSAVSLAVIAIGNWPVLSLVITGYVVVMIGALLGMPKDG